MKKADLHIHSDFSDSSQTITEIFEAAASRGLSAIAVTDHDTVDGIEEAADTARKFGIEFIPGIELTAEHEGREIHVLGYFFDYGSEMLKDRISGLKQLRFDRITDMATRLKGFGLPIRTEELLNDIGASMPTRLHLAQYMLRKGIVASVHSAFEQYLAPDKSAFVYHKRFSVSEAVEIIRSAGGVSVLAHPHFLPGTEWIRDFKTMGIDGIEVHYPGFDEKKRNFYMRISEELDLLKAGGSDAHGGLKKSTRVGSVYIPYEWVEEIKNARRQVFSQKNI